MILRLARIASVAAFLTLGFGTNSPVHAQEAPVDAPAEGGGGGDPLYGYVGTAFLAAGAMFVLCKSARR